MSNASFVFLRGLRFHSPVGVLQQEKVVGNDIVIDVKIGYPFQNAMKSDDVADTLNYAEVYGIIRQLATQPVDLLERLAGKIASELCREYPRISTIDLRITKENPPMGGDCDGAGIEIHLINPKTEE